ncbi:MAG: hypothetical protein AAFX06_27430 [Planctomycetota bacterium]
METVLAIVGTLLLIPFYAYVFDLTLGRFIAPRENKWETQEDMSNSGCQTSMALLGFAIPAAFTVFSIRYVLGW